MADYGWRNDERRRWDRNTERMHNQQGYGYGRPDDERFAGESQWNGDDWRRQERDFGRESNYGAGYATPRNDFDDLRQRPGGMRDQQDRGGGYRSGIGNRGNFADYRGNFGSYPYDYQDYGDWQGQGSYAGYGGPRFGDNYGREQDASGRGYGNYGGQGRGFSPSGPDYGDSRETNRNFWNRASDEVASWTGDDEAGRRRDMDRARSHFGRGPKGYIRSDDRIREDVSDRLTDDWRLDASNIEVGVSDGEVTLAGTVGNRDDKHRAEHLIESLSGVRHVQNNLRVDVSWRHAASGDQSTSTPVGSSGNNTSIAGQNRPGTYGTQSSTGSATGTTPGNNASSTH